MTKRHERFITVLAHRLRQKFQSDTSGHDWLHLERVWKMAQRLAQGENINQFVLDMAALLHDVDDYKFKKDRETEFSRTEEILASLQLTDEVKQQVFAIIRSVSFKGAGIDTTPASLEGKIVQDADRLEAMGAIGIARVFTYGGSAGYPYYDPTIKPLFANTFGEYKNHKKTTINHFYEKLLLLKDRMNTPQAKKIAERRHKFLEAYLREFFAEVEGKA